MPGLNGWRIALGVIAACGGGGSEAHDAHVVADGGSSQDGAVGPGSTLQGLKTRVEGEVVQVTRAVSLDVSGDGQTLLVGTARDLLYYSSDGGESWFSVRGLGPSSYWAAVATSRDGKTLVAVGDQVFVSRDAGETWTVESELFFDGTGQIAMAEDGRLMVRNLDTDLTNVALSRDFGVTWQTRDVANDGRYLRDIALSADGTRILLVHEHAPLMLSGDGGESFNEASAGAEAWQAGAMSADGLHQVAVSFGATSDVETSAKVAISSDGGGSWTSRTLDDVYALTEVAISDDGEQILASSTAVATLRYSTDGGANFAPIAGPITSDELDHQYRLAFARDDTRILALHQNTGDVWRSDDAGESWSLTIDGQ